MYKEFNSKNASEFVGEVSTMINKASKRFTLTRSRLTKDGGVLTIAALPEKHYNRETIKQDVEYLTSRLTSMLKDKGVEPGKYSVKFSTTNATIRLHIAIVLNKEDAAKRRMKAGGHPEFYGKVFLSDSGAKYRIVDYNPRASKMPYICQLTGTKLVSYKFSKVYIERVMKRCGVMQ